MTPADITKAREVLGVAWGLGRSVHKSELGRLLGFGGRDPGVTIMRYEHGADPSPLFVVVMEMMLDGARPRGLAKFLRARQKRPSLRPLERELEK